MTLLKRILNPLHGLVARHQRENEPRRPYTHQEVDDACYGALEGDLREFFAPRSDEQERVT